MTTKEIIQHPNSTSIKHIALGALAALLLQHGIDVHEQLTTLSQFFGSEEFKGAIAAAIAIFSAVQHGLQPAQVTSPANNALPTPDVSPLVLQRALPMVATQLPPAPAPAPQNPGAAAPQPLRA